MYLAWVLVAMMALTGVYAMFDAEQLQATPSPTTMGLAQSMSEYRQALIAYALSHPTTQGSVSATQLAPFLAPYATNSLWQTYIAPNSNEAGSWVAIYTTSSSAATAIPGIEQMSQGSALAGVANNGFIVSPGNPAIPLPAAIAAAVPSGTPVWLAQAY